MIKSGIFVGMMVALCSAGAAAGGTFPAEGLSGVFVSAGGGQISVEGAAGGSVEVSPLKADGVCEVRAKVVGKELRITKQKGKDGAVSDCLIKLPAKLALKVKMGAGDLEVKGLSGPVAIHKTVGKTSLSGLTGDLKVDMVSGSLSGTINPSELSITGTGGRVDLSGLGCGVSVQRVTGGLALAWASPPSSEVRIKSAGGKVRLAFPADAKISTELKTKENGRIHDEFGKGAGTLVAVTLSGGSVDVVKAK